MIHINYRKADRYVELWCPYCDEVVLFGQQEWYDDVWCTKCGRIFSPDYRHHQWPKGLDIHTGELINDNSTTGKS